jgi:hypothetical protein
MNSIACYSTSCVILLVTVTSRVIGLPVISYYLETMT